MSSKAEILNRIKQNQPDLVTELPDLSLLGSENFDTLETYKTQNLTSTINRTKAAKISF